MKPRIAIVAPNYYPRTCGVGDHSMRVASELMRRGIDVAVFARGDVERNPQAPEVPVFGCPAASPMVIGRNLHELIVRWGATEVLVQYTPQMFDASRFGSLAVPALVGRVRRRGLPVTILAHEIYTPWSPRPDLALAALCHRLMLAALLRSATRAAVTTEARRQRIFPLARLLGVSDRIRVVRVGPSAIPPLRPPARSGIQLGAFSTMTVGKRFDALLAAFAVIGEQEPTARLVLTGDLGRVEHRAFRSLLEGIRTHPYADRISVTGKLPLDQVSTMVAGLSMFFHPDEIGACTRSSTLPLAFGSGVPVVAFRGIETDSLFVDGENVAFTSTNPQDIAATMLRVIRSDALAGRLSAGGRRLYDEHLTWTRIVSQLLAPSGDA